MEENKNLEVFDDENGIVKSEDQKDTESKNVSGLVIAGGIAAGACVVYATYRLVKWSVYKIKSGIQKIKSEKEPQIYPVDVEETEE